jgi:transcriptional regulator with XRE-family HTH domain
MAKKESRRSVAERLLKQLLTLDDIGLRAVERTLKRMQTRSKENERLQTILAKVPGESLAEKARVVGVTRQAFHYWATGQARPNTQQLAKLAELTGASVAKLRGRKASKRDVVGFGEERAGS